MSYRLKNMPVDNSKNYNLKESGRDYSGINYNQSQGYDNFLNKTGDYSG